MLTCKVIYLMGLVQKGWDLKVPSIHYSTTEFSELNIMCFVPAALALPHRSAVRLSGHGASLGKGSGWALPFASIGTHLEKLNS